MNYEVDWIGVLFCGVLTIASGLVLVCLIVAMVTTPS